MDGVVGKRRNLERKAESVPTGVSRCRPLLKWVVHIHREIEQPPWCEHTGSLLHNLTRTLRVVDDIVTHHDVEASVLEWKLFTERCEGARAPLPSRKH